MTALFCDVTGSTVLGRTLDPEALRAVMEEYFASVSMVLTRHGGTVEKFVGDAVMAVFGAPVSHEDDAVRACRASVEILAAVGDVDHRVTSRFGVRFGVRIGVETGEVVVGDTSRGSTFATGPAVNTAARLEQSAPPGQCLIGPECYRLARDRLVVEATSALTLKGIDGTVAAFRLLDVREDDGERPARVPMVGRSREVALLRQSFDRAASDRTCQLVTVLGQAGIGKSRLAQEFLALLDGLTTVLRGRCVPYGEGVTYWPLVQAVRQAAGLTGAEPEAEARTALAHVLDGVADADEILAKVAPVAGLGGAPGPPEDTAWAFQKLLGALASKGPVVLVIDDLHWAEPGLVSLVEGVCDWSRDAAILVVVFARPEFLDDHSGWGAGRTNAVTALLEPLGDEEMDLLTRSLLGGVLAGESGDRVRRAAGGNPLFVEQLLAMLVEDGDLTQDGDGWLLRADASSLQIPPTITALLAARLDRLSGAQRAVLAPAAVMGQVFYAAPVAELSGIPGDVVMSHLRALDRQGLIRPTESDIPAQMAFRFGHVLIRDTAYGAIPKATRAELHERFARWLDEHVQGPSCDDFVGSHLETAFTLRSELRGLDDSALALGLEAADRLEAAGRLLLFADDEAAIHLLERADALRSDEGPGRWALQIELARAWSGSSVRLFDAAAYAGRVRRRAEDAGDDVWASLAELVTSMIELRTHPASGADHIRATSGPALELFAAVEDHLGQSVAHQALSEVANTDARATLALHHVLRAAHHSELAGRQREAQAFRRQSLAWLMFDDTPAHVGLNDSRNQFAVAGHRADRCVTAGCTSFFASLSGEREEAASAWATAQRLAVGLQEDMKDLIRLGRSHSTFFTGQWSIAAGLLGEVCDRMADAAEVGYLATYAALHAHALLYLGQTGSARERVELSRRIGGWDDVVTRGLTEGAEAWLAALDGDPAAWGRHTTTATATLPAEQLLNRAAIHEACAEGALVLGLVPEARQHREQAIALHRAKGNVVSVSRLERML